MNSKGMVDGRPHFPDAEANAEGDAFNAFEAVQDADWGMPVGDLRQH